MSEGKKGFKVVDRRRFDADGEEREGVEDRAEVQAASEPEHQPIAAETASGETPAQAAAKQPAPAPSAPTADEQEPATEPASKDDPNEKAATALFLGFVNSLGQQCAMHLGLVPYPSGHRELQLDAARDTIDILSVLMKKTEGNLSGEEKSFLQGLTHELRMTYLDVTNKVSAAGGPEQPPGKHP